MFVTEGVNDKDTDKDGDPKVSAYFTCNTTRVITEGN